MNGQIQLDDPCSKKSDHNIQPAPGFQYSIRRDLSILRMADRNKTAAVGSQSGKDKSGSLQYLLTMEDGAFC
jgi:hypothetical protein